MTSAELTPAVETRRLSLADLLAMKTRAEIIDGKVIEVPSAGGLHHLVARNIYRLLDSFVRLAGIGEVFFDGLIYLMYSPEQYLKHSFIPDVSFVRLENIPKQWNVEKPHPGVPDLAVEVISPGDEAEDIQAKVRTYLDKGTEQVWLAYPQTKELHQYIAGETEIVRIYKGSQKMDVETLFPGIDGLTIDAIFTLPEWVTK